MVKPPFQGYVGVKWGVVHTPGYLWGPLFMLSLAWSLASNVGSVDVTVVPVGSRSKGTWRAHGPVPEMRALHPSPCLILAQSMAISHRCRSPEFRSTSSSQGSWNWSHNLCLSTWHHKSNSGHACYSREGLITEAVILGRRALSVLVWTAILSHAVNEGQGGAPCQSGQLRASQKTGVWWVTGKEGSVGRGGRHGPGSRGSQI